jgi:hypothetical protein
VSSAVDADADLAAAAAAEARHFESAYSDEQLEALVRNKGVASG